MQDARRSAVDRLYRKAVHKLCRRRFLPSAPPLRARALTTLNHHFPICRHHPFIPHKRHQNTMAYSELIKNIGQIRSYIREFFVFGFKHRMEYDKKSARSYDNERRRIESWLGDYMFYEESREGRQFFLSVDSRAIPRNPLYQVFKTRSFTEKSILLHFYLLDLLAGGRPLTVSQIYDALWDRYLSAFDTDLSFDLSTVRKKLQDYAALGIIAEHRAGRDIRYSLAEETVSLPFWRDALLFFSEENPLGVIGSFLLDRLPETADPFRFKHHYLLGAADSEILEEALTGMREKRNLSLSLSGRSGAARHTLFFPIKLYQSVQSGRQYLIGWDHIQQSLLSVRADSILTAEKKDTPTDAARLCAAYEAAKPHIWGVCIGTKTEHVELLIHMDDGEDYIRQRLLREKRCGAVEEIDRHTLRFTADVYESNELLPWIRTFTGRIIRFSSSNPAVTRRFYRDLNAMNRIYGEEP